MTRRLANPAEFRRLDLRCHALLSDVPLHNAWVIPLDGGGPGRTIGDVLAILFGGRLPPAHVAVRALFALRSAFGRMFRWDEARHDPPSASYIHRLTASDRAQSQMPPGSRQGRLRLLYVLSDESLSELRNATVHAFLALALVPRATGYTLYLAIYVKPVSRFTPIYMALIDPFRRLLVYPALGRRVQQAWRRAYAQTG